MELLAGTETQEVAVTIGTKGTFSPVVKTEKAPLYEFINVRGGTKRIRLLSDDLRSFIFYNMDVGIVKRNHLSAPGDAEHILKHKRITSVYEMTAFFDTLGAFKNLQKDDFDEYEDISWDKFQSFVEMLEAENEIFSEKAMTAFKTDEVTYDVLNSYLNSKNRKVAFTHEGHIVGFITKSCSKEVNMFTGPFLSVTGTVHINDGKGFNKSITVFKIPYFTGTKSLKDLGLYDLDNDKETSEYLLERGKKYVEFTKNPAYLSYEGDVTRRTYWFTHRGRATGRVMIDIGAMRNIDTNYDTYFGYDRYRQNNNQNDIGILDLSDDLKITTPPYIYGFSFTAKTWGELLVDNAKSINFRSDAFDKLVLDADTKDIVFSLVETEFKVGTDLIDGKGGGCIFLLEGPPGVGKTLTAEAVAEKLHRPLYTVGVGELGTDVTMLEETLKNILDVANSWNAVLLIDEADIFLAERNDLDIERNAMVGVFLRLLEYYPGILFLTTNLADTIDQAFYSRISMAISYPKLEEENRKIIWDNLLANVSVTGINTAELAKHDINGRQIKNCIRNSMALANHAKRDVQMSDFARVINKALEFKKILGKNAK